MPNKKVFCDSCVYLSCEGKIIYPKLYDSIQFRTNPNKHISHGTKLCSQGMEKKTEVIDNPIYKEIKFTITVDDPFIRNSNNDCCMYKQKLLLRMLSCIRNILK
jgi:hypothetical protein